MVLNNRARLFVRNVPDLNEMWSHNFGKGRAVLVLSKTEGLYIEESNEEVTFGKALSASSSTLFGKKPRVISSANRRKNLP